MALQKGHLKPIRGNTLPLNTDPDTNAETLRQLAEKKMRDFNKDPEDEGPFILLYPDASEIISVPGTDNPFVLKEYKAEVGKPYQGITFFLCTK